MAKIPEASSRGHDLHCEFDGCCVQLRPEDISQVGVFIGTTEPPALDRELALKLRSALGEIEVKCQVVQVITRARATAEQRNPGFGVLFFDLSDDQRAFIGLTLDAHTRAERQRSQAAAEHDRRCALRDQTLLRLERELQALRDKPPHAALGLNADATKEAIRKAYLEVSKRYHPHVYAHFDSPDISRVATELFIAHKRAYTALQSQKPQAAGAEPCSEPAARVTPEPAAPAPPPAQPQVSRAPAPPRVTQPAATRRRSRAPAAPAPEAPPEVSLRPPRAPKTPSGIGLRSSLAPGGAARAHSMVPPRARAPRVPAAPGLQTDQRPRHPDAELALQSGLKHLTAARFEKAALQIELALQLCPDLREAAIWQRVCRARERKALGEQEAALAEYRALLELDPEHDEALEHVGDSGRRANTGRSSK